MKKKYNIENLSTLVKGELFFMITKKAISDKLVEKYNDLYKEAYLHLMYIGNVDGISQIELSKVTNTNTSTLHRNIISLIENGYVEKRIAARANENEIYLTEKGEESVSQINEWILECERDLGLTEQQLKVVDNVLLRIINKNIKH